MRLDIIYKHTRLYYAYGYNNNIIYRLLHVRAMKTWNRGLGQNRREPVLEPKNT